MPLYLVPTQQGRTIPLDKPVLFFGRHPECDVVLTRSRKVSRKHCCIAQVDEHFFIRDLGSMNGIRVNGKRVQRTAPLKVGDEVSIGDVIYRLQTQNGTTPPKEVHKGKPAAVKGANPPARPKRPHPVELSQEFPVAIPEDEEFDEESARPTPESMPMAELVDEDDVIELGEDDLLEESGELPNRGSRRS